MTKNNIVKQILQNRNNEPKAYGSAFAPANIALCKYWGKRDEELNLPVTSSLSVSLGRLGAQTDISTQANADVMILNDKEISSAAPSAQRLFSFLDLFRPDEQSFFRVETRSDIPIAAGLASSASGFAALVCALDELFAWKLDRQMLSILARLGSGSACRSLYEGFVKWHAGKTSDGMDSYAEPLAASWPELRMGLLILSREQKPIGSRSAMKLTKETSTLYKAWPTKVEKDMNSLETAIAEQNFDLLGKTAESNALAMHATMIDSQPPIIYWHPETVSAMRRIHELRKDGLPVYFTMDAGPNIKLLFLEEHCAAVQENFPQLEIVELFA